MCSLFILLSLLVCQTYSGRSASGRPLIFRLRDPSFPSQHHTRLDLSNNTSTPLEAPLLSHSQDVHRPKSITTVRLKISTDITMTGHYSITFIKTIIFCITSFLKVSVEICIWDIILCFYIILKALSALYESFC